MHYSKRERDSLISANRPSENRTCLCIAHRLPEGDPAYSNCLVGQHYTLWVYSIQKISESLSIGTYEARFTYLHVIN